MSINLARFSRAFFWHVGGKWGVRLLSIMSSLVLVRTLTPEAFGVVAVAVFITELTKALLQSGSDTYLRVAEEVNFEVVSTAWTMRIIIAVLAGACIIFASSATSRFVSSPDVKTVVIAYAFLPFIQALGSPGIELGARNMHFAPLAKFGIQIKMVGILVTIPLALLGFSYWSLVIGDLFSNLFRSAYSHVRFKVHFGFSLKNIAKQWAFTKWVSLTAISGYMRSRTETLFVGAAFGVDVLGSLQVAQRFSQMPTTEAILPVTQPLLSSLRENPGRERDFVSRYLALGMLAVFPASAGMCLLSEQIIRTILGEQWLGADLAFSVTALLSVPVLLHTGARLHLTVARKLNLMLLSDALVISLIALPFVLAMFVNFEQFLWFRLIVGLLYTLVIVLTLSLSLGYKLSHWLDVFLVPTVSTFSMGLVLMTLLPWSFSSDLNTIMIVSIGGAVSYFSAALALTIIFRGSLATSDYLIKNTMKILVRQRVR